MRINRHTISRLLDIGLIVCVAIWLTIQILVVCYVQDIPQSGDALRYEELAKESIEAGSWYPLTEHIELHYPEETHPLYICYPGLINLIEIYLFLFGTIKAAFWFNILFNVITLISIFHIFTSLCGRNSAKLAALLFCLYPYQALSVGASMSEIPCIALIYGSIALACNKKYGYLFASGFVIMLAQYVRSIAVLFAIPLLIYLIIYQRKWKLVGSYVAGIVLTVLTLISFNRLVSGYAFLSSTTLGINMFIGANNDADGGYIITQFMSDTVSDDITEKNVFETDKILRKHAVDWIKNNPVKWINLIPVKLKYEMMPADEIYLTRGPENAIFDTNDIRWKAIVIYWLWFPKLYHYSIYLFSIIGLWFRRNRIIGADGIILLPFLGGLALAILTVGHPRYNMPYMPILIYFAVWGIRFLTLKLCRR